MRSPNKEETEETLSLARYKSVDQVPPIKVLYNEYDLLIINKPACVRMDGKFEVTVEKLLRYQFCDEKNVDKNDN